MPRAIPAALLPALTLALAGGCSPPQPATVSGRVTFDGQPLKAGTVGFHPSGGGGGYYAQIGEDGRYEIAGELRSGSYRVTVAGTEPPKPGGKGPALHGKGITPDKYADRNQTELRATVQPGANTLDFEVKSE